MLSALPASPRAAIGCPSKQVATDAGVPGILSRIAEIRPPDVPPIYRASSSEMPSIGDMPKVTGRNRATPMVTVRPGMAPTMMPTIVPLTMSAMTFRVRTERMPEIIMMGIPASDQPRMPAGSMTWNTRTKSKYATAEEMSAIAPNSR